MLLPSTSMNFEEFVATQVKFAAKSEFWNYLPTLWVETSRKLTVHVLTDAPDGAELDVVARQWAEQLAGKHDYFLAFKAGRVHLKAIARIDGLLQETNALVAT